VPQRAPVQQLADVAQGLGLRCRLRCAAKAAVNVSCHGRPSRKYLPRRIMQSRKRRAYRSSKCRTKDGSGCALVEAGAQLLDSALKSNDESAAGVVTSGRPATPPWRAKEGRFDGGQRKGAAVSDLRAYSGSLLKGSTSGTPRLIKPISFACRADILGLAYQTLFARSCRRDRPDTKCPPYRSRKSP